MKQIVCDICGKKKEGLIKEDIEGRLRICSYSHSKDGSTTCMTCECKDVYLCTACSRRLMKCVRAMKEHKRIRIGRSRNEE